MVTVRNGERSGTLNGMQRSYCTRQTVWNVCKITFTVRSRSKNERNTVVKYSNFQFFRFSEDEKKTSFKRKEFKYLSKNVIKNRKLTTNCTSSIPLTSKHCTQNKYIYLSQSDIEISLPSSRTAASCILGSLSSSNITSTNKRPQSAKDSSKFTSNNPIKITNKSKLENFFKAFC